MNVAGTLGAEVRAVRNDSDRADLEAWLCQPRRALAVDVETCGLGWHDPIRLVQFGDCEVGWAIDPEQYPHLIHGTLVNAPRLVAHNSGFDLPRLAQLIAPNDPKPLLDQLARKTWDTKLISHVLDPRGPETGAVGHSLKPLCDAHVAGGSSDGQRALKDRFRELGLAAADGFREIPIWDPIYWQYGCLDTVLTARLLEVLGPQIHQRGLGDLATFEHDVARLCMAMSITGIAIDLPLAYAWDSDLDAIQKHHAEVAASLGVANPNSTAQVAAALTERGVSLTEVTNSGAPKVDKVVLERANDPLADAVLAYKKAAKNAAQLQTIISHAEVDGRVRPQINSLKAVTARMSIVEPALQTIPPDMRGMFLADEGQTWVSADYAQVELRVAAALSQEPAWIEAFAAGEDVHQSVADRVGVTRKTAKALNFGVLYGGGKAALARAADIDQVEAGAAVSAFKREHPRFTKWARALSESIVHSPDGIMVTRTGRPIPVDAAFAWRSCNYQIQSTARDLLAGALIEAEKAGLADAIRLPLHDEFLASVDEADADDYLAALVEAMGGVLDGVQIQVEGTRIGQRWGDHHRPEVPDG